MESSGNLLAKLTALVHQKPECPAKGFLTISGWAKKWGNSITTARRLITVGVDSGLMEAKEYNVKLRQRVLPVWHYREVGGKK